MAVRNLNHLTGHDPRMSVCQQPVYWLEDRKATDLRRRRRSIGHASHADPPDVEEVPLDSDPTVFRPCPKRYAPFSQGRMGSCPQRGRAARRCAASRARISAFPTRPKEGGGMIRVRTVLVVLGVI